MIHEAAVDFDVVAHIGYVKNIDLSHKVNLISYDTVDIAAVYLSYYCCV